MNIFYTDKDPEAAARSLPDKHVVKMPVETVQMLVSALLRHGIQPRVFTSKGTIHKGGYHHHPSTIWAGDTQANAMWLWQHGMSLCAEYSQRYGKTHFAEGQLMLILDYLPKLPAGDLTSPTLAMPAECKTADPVESYRNCIRAKVAAKPKSFVWSKGTAAPTWL
ncbi:hypothetical protein OMCYN_01774 [cyanobiont of Ornithocercus magnificus]|nr:hypothetical protein OMCYN_01774 [cyanobiont of Ornithocercus magnificus]